jgi:hypothetical protein
MNLKKLILEALDHAERRRKRHLERMASEVLYALRMSCRNRFRDFIRSKGKIGFGKYVTMDYERLKDHLEKQFKPGMTWKNRNKWHIDHIRPLSSYKYINDDGTINKKEIEASWNIKNMQPLWDHENLTKGKRWNTKPKRYTL